MPIRLLLIFLFLINFNTVFSQKNTSEIGVGVQAIDYYGPLTKRYFVFESWNAVNTKYKNFLAWDFGYFIQYKKQITPHIKFSSKLNFNKLNKPTATTNELYFQKKIGDTNSTLQSSYLIGLATSCNYYFFSKQNYFLKPYINVGFAINSYSSQFNFQIPVGIGFDFKISKKINLNYESNYVFPVSKNEKNCLQHQVGFTFRWNKNSPKKKKQPQIDASVQAEKEFILKDSDNDGVVDSLDDCPLLAGKIVNHGCPDTDNDGVFDNVDKCPELSGLKENDGCPLLSEEELGNKINEYLHTIIFDSNSAKLSTESTKSLDSIAILLQKYTAYTIDIEGHTDNLGNEEENILLSQQRADACKNYFIKKVIDEGRITSVGFGSMKPIYENDTPEGREKNRRIEIILTKKE